MTYMNGTLFLYLVLNIFYLWHSGYPQIADFILFTGMLMMVFYTLSNSRMVMDSVYLSILAYSALTIVINLIYYAYLHDPRLFFSSMYYIYNSLAFILIAYLFSKTPDLTAKVIYVGIVVAVFAELFFCLVYPEYSNRRLVGTFNNPNQLADWGLFMSCALVMLKIYRRFTLFDYVLLFCMLYMQTLSLSKASLICSILFFLSLPFSPVVGRTSKAFIFFWRGHCFYYLYVFSLLHSAKTGKAGSCGTRRCKIGKHWP
ncbi:MAG: hypothetical protein LRZ85_05990 [Alphaproteobacteria bacterium]|nr:hypothetical protein [Alphaproteobacteria bacterium]